MYIVVSMNYSVRSLFSFHCVFPIFKNLYNFSIYLLLQIALKELHIKYISERHIILLLLKVNETNANALMMTKIY